MLSRMRLRISAVLPELQLYNHAIVFVLQINRQTLFLSIAGPMWPLLRMDNSLLAQVLYSTFLGPGLLVWPQDTLVSGSRSSPTRGASAEP